MKIVFLNRDTGTGGLQTAMLRMARWLKANGHEVILLTMHLGNLTEVLRQEAKIVRVDYLNYFGARISPDLRDTLRGIDCVHTFSWDSLLLAIQLSRATGAVLVTGVYHPRAFNFFPSNPRPYYADFYRQTFAALQDENIFFMNEGTRGTAKVDFDRPFQNSVLLPVPMELPAVRRPPLHGKPAPLRLLSIGRLVNFKRYPFGLLSHLKKRNRSSPDLTFSIFGDGPDRLSLEQSVERLGLQESVFVRGELPYHSMEQTLLEHHVFIGMGTASLEAAASAMPTIVAPVYGDGKLLSGYFHEQTGYNYGESAGSRPSEHVLDQLMSMSSDELRVLGERERKTAEQFETKSVMSRYLVLIGRMQQEKPLDLPVISNSQLWRVLLSGVLSTRVPLLRNYWRRRNWHHPAQHR